MTINEFAELLSALTDGGKTAIHGDELGAMFPANKMKTVVLDVEAKSRARHFAKACGWATSVRGRALEGRDITRMAPRKIVKLGIARPFQVPQLFLEQTVGVNLMLAITARQDGWWSARSLGNAEMHDEAFDLLTRLGVADQASLRADELPEGTRKLIDIALALALVGILRRAQPLSDAFSSRCRIPGAKRTREIRACTSAFAPSRTCSELGT
jgi:hypothetical protein